MANVAVCEEKAAEKKDEVAVEAKDGGPEKKQDKRGIFGETYGSFGGDFDGHGWDHDDHHDHHVQHHHEKTITVIKKVPQPYPGTIAHLNEIESDFLLT